MVQVALTRAQEEEEEEEEVSTPLPAEGQLPPLQFITHDHPFCFTYCVDTESPPESARSTLTR